MPQKLSRLELNISHSFLHEPVVNICFDEYICSIMPSHVAMTLSSLER